MQHRCDSDSTLRHSQNFLHSGALVDRLLDASSIQPQDLVLDLGAGRGVISRRLALRGCQVVAVEKDPLLAAHLRLRFDGVRNVKVHYGDILRVTLPHRAYKVFSNIPFDATADSVSRLTGAACPPRDAYLVVQREAAERFIGDSRTTLGSVLLFPWFAATLFHEFRRADFTPVPRVDVVMLRLHKRGPPLVAPTDAQLYRDFVIELFTARGRRLSDSLGELVGKHRAARLARTLDLADELPTRIPHDAWLELFRLTRAIMGDELRARVAHSERRLRQQQRRLQKVHRTRSRRLRPPPLVRQTEARAAASPNMRSGHARRQAHW